eukprot:177349_1
MDSSTKFCIIFLIYLMFDCSLLFIMQNSVAKDVVTRLFYNYTKQDLFNGIHNANIRISWHVNSLCCVFSRSNEQWYKGKIKNIFITDYPKQEWLIVNYGKNKTKKIQRFCMDIQPIDYIDNKSETLTEIIQYIFNKLKFKRHNTNFIPQPFTLIPVNELKIYLIHGYIRNIARYIVYDINLICMQYYGEYPYISISIKANNSKHSRYFQWIEETNYPSLTKYTFTKSIEERYQIQYDARR